MSATMQLPKLPTKGNSWTGSEMVHPKYEPRESELDPGWLSVTCGCCGGLEWGGEYPTEHGECGGNGYYWVHAASGVGALWPGGPFNGTRYDPADCVRWLASPDPKNPDDRPDDERE